MESLQQLHAAGLCHVTLSSLNVLLDDAFEPKLTNFGVTNPASSLSVVAFTPGATVHPSMYIFAFGTLLYEMETHDIPYGNVADNEEFLRRTTGGCAFAESANCPSDLKKLATACLNRDPALRPRSDYVLDQLRSFDYEPRTTDNLQQEAGALRNSTVTLKQLDATALRQGSMVAAKASGFDCFEGTFRQQRVLIKRPTDNCVKCRARPTNKVASPYLVNLLGVAHMGTAKPAIVVEWSSCSLRYVLLSGVTYAQRLQLALGVAQGIEHLHSRSWVHCDICVDNIFVSDQMHAKVGMMGSARHNTDPKITSTDPKLTCRDTTGPYSAPELLASAPHSLASDVFAFGVLLFVIATGVDPYAEELKTITACGVLQRVQQGDHLRMLDKLRFENFSHLMAKCLSTEPSCRWTMRKIVQYLQQLVIAQDTKLHRPIPPTSPIQVDRVADIKSTQCPTETLKFLGIGSAGSVYLVQGDSEQWARKTLNGEHQTNRYLRRAFFAEMQLLHRLCSEYFVRFVGVDATAEPPAFYMEYVPSQPLAFLLNRMAEGSVLWPQRIDLALQLIKAIIILHENGYVHLDIKPANVLITASGGIKLINFGEARVASCVDFQRVCEVGTLFWMAPELFKYGQSEDLKAADIYSFGIVFDRNCHASGALQFQKKFSEGLRPTLTSSDIPVPFSELATLS
ncbi:serine/threonineprotein kinase [Achlya hypogyna]|uniref:Serine/threonineprotein kinase n=1 Tax=Achlya hypogyna TaxID=1202772 RepID=A0A1V9YCR6_ACHHY|nr:serine/threonineprotein kinase [Achlya hypogyna]